MATLRRPTIPGMNVRETPMSGAQQRAFGLQPSVGGMSATERPMLPNERAQFGLKAAPPNIDAEVTQRAAQMRANRIPTPAPVAAAAPPTVAPGQQSLMDRARNGLRGLRGASSTPTATPPKAPLPQRAGFGAGRLLRGVAPLAAGAGVASGLGNYTINDPEVDSSASGTFNALRNGDFAGAGRGLSKGALEAGMDLGGVVAGAADYFRPGARAGYDNMLRNQFGDQLQIGDGATTAPLTPGVAAPTPAPSPAGSGRGNPESPLRADRDPSSAAFGASRDFTNELANVPAQLPGDLRRGVIHKTQGPNGTVYSGMDVGGGGNAQMVDGMGATLRGRGSVNVVQGMSRDEIDRTLRRGEYAPAAGGQAPMPQGAAPGSLLDTPKARRAQEALRQGREQLDVTRRGQDLSFAASSARTQEMRESRGATAREKAATAAENRRRTSEYMKAGGGDPLSAAKAARMAGDSDIAADLEKGAEGEDKIAVQRNEQYRKILAPLATATDKDGKGRVDEAELERMVGLADSAAQATGLTVEELQSNPAKFRGAVKLVEALNKNREDTWLKKVGWDDTDPVSQIPAMRDGNLRARSEKVLNPFSASGFGARRINLPNGGVVTLDPDTWDDPEVRDLLTGLGVK